MSQEMLAAVKAGLISFILYLFIFGVGLGFIFLFLPTLPIFYVGLRNGSRCATNAMLFASGPIALMTGFAGLSVYAILFAFPAVYLCKRSVPSTRSRSSSVAPPPIGPVIVDLSIMGCVLMASATLYYWSHPGGLPGHLATSLSESFTQAEPEYAEIITKLAVQWSFLIFPITIWLWGLMLYAHGWLAHRLILRNGVALRPDFTVTPFEIPSWLLGLIGICSLAALIGSDSMRFLGRASLIALMLPYFFLGIAWLRARSKDWPQGGLMLFFIYFMVFTQFWPALILSGIGIWQQIKGLSASKS